MKARRHPMYIGELQKFYMELEPQRETRPDYSGPDQLQGPSVHDSMSLLDLKEELRSRRTTHQKTDGRPREDGWAPRVAGATAASANT